MLEKLFKLSEHGTNVRTELLAGLTTFLTMAYIIFVNPAPGMGLNAFFSYTVVGSMGYSWEVALGAVFLSGLMFFLLSIFRIREWIINSIPMALRSAIAAGIGLFLALIALKNAGIRSNRRRL